MDGVAGPSPLYAEGNQYVLQELLGASDETLATLLAAGLIAAEPQGGR